MIINRGNQKSCRYQGLSFEIIQAHYVSGVQAFENIGNLSDEGPRAALRCSLFVFPSILPRQCAVSRELWTHSTVIRIFLVERAL